MQRLPGSTYEDFKPYMTDNYKQAFEDMFPALDILDDLVEEARKLTEIAKLIQLEEAK